MTGVVHDLTPRTFPIILVLIRLERLKIILFCQMIILVNLRKPDEELFVFQQFYWNYQNFRNVHIATVCHLNFIKVFLYFYNF